MAGVTKARPRPRKGESFRHVVVLSDTQYPYIDKKSEAAVADFVIKMEPDVLVSIGDFVDFFSLGTYLKRQAPSTRTYLAKEVRQARDKLCMWASYTPRAKRYLIAGNHEDRLDRYIEKHAVELQDLVELDDDLQGSELTVPGLLKTSKYGWEYVGPYGAGMWLGKPGGLWATHGQYCTKNAAEKHLTMYGVSVIYGHTHRLKSFHRCDMMRTIGAYEIGCLCDLRTTPRNTPWVDWQHGFASVWVSDTTKRFHVDLIAITDGRFVYGGKVYGG